MPASKKKPNSRATGPTRPSRAATLNRERKMGRAAVTSRTIQKRARQLATIAERRRSKPTATERQDAKDELVGEDRLRPKQRTERTRKVSIWETAPVSTGQRTKPIRARDEQEFATEQAERGAREAEHDRMLAARSRQERSK